MVTVALRGINFQLASYPAEYRLQRKAKAGQLFLSGKKSLEIVLFLIIHYICPSARLGNIIVLLLPYKISLLSVPTEAVFLIRLDSP